MDELKKTQQIVHTEEEYDAAMYENYRRGFMDGSDKTAKEIVTKLEQLQRCLKQVALHEFITSLQKQYGLDIGVNYEKSSL